MYSQKLFISNIAPPKLAGMLKNDYNVDVDPQTVRVVLKNARYNGQAAVKKFYIRIANRVKCLELGKESHQ